VILIIFITGFIGSGCKNIRITATENNNLIPTFGPRAYGGIDFDTGHAIIKSDDGGYVIAGYTSSCKTGPTEVYIIKVDGNGNKIWEKTYGINIFDAGYGITKSYDGGHVIVGFTSFYGVTRGEIYVIKVDGNGDKVWAKTYGRSGYDRGYAITKSYDSGYVIVGNTSNYGAGPTDVYIIKVDGNGDCVWAKTYGGNGFDSGYAITKSYDGGYVIAGYIYSYGGENDNVYIIKVDSNGDCVWAKAYGGSGYDRGYTITKSDDGGYVIAGYTTSYGAGSYDVYIIKVDSNGNCVWAKAYGGSGYEWGGYGVTKSEDGGYIITGYTDSYGAGNYDIYIIKVDSNGDCVWAKTYGGSNDDRGYTITKSYDSGYVIAGDTRSYGAGNSDVYITKIDDNGNQVW